MAKKNTKENPLKYAKDEFGKDVLLKEDNLQVMMEWEKPYMEACIDALKPKGDVLEIGFGMGYSATQIQKYHPKSHTIIEIDPTVIEQAKLWAKKYPHVKIVEGAWQEKLGKLGQFDIIFFDDYSPLSQDDVKKLQQNVQQSNELADVSKNMHETLETAMQSLGDIKFSDEQLKDFAHEVLKKYQVTPAYVLKFVNNLQEWGNITNAQKNKFAKEFEKEVKKQGTAKEEQPDIQLSKQLLGDRFIAFAEACLDAHMKKGARLSAYMGSPESKQQHPEFQKRILSRKDIRYSEKTIHVDVPANCRYFSGDKALVIVLEKK